MVWREAEAVATKLFTTNLPVNEGVGRQRIHVTEIALQRRVQAKAPRTRSGHHGIHSFATKVADITRAEFQIESLIQSKIAPLSDGLRIAH